MYRVELKVMLSSPCMPAKRIAFLMYRVELKGSIRLGSRHQLGWFLMYRVELKGPILVEE